MYTTTSASFLFFPPGSDLETRLFHSFPLLLRKLRKDLGAFFVGTWLSVDGPDTHSPDMMFPKKNQIC